MNGQKIAYKRVSSVGQNTDRQLDGEQFDRQFVDKATGANADRPQLQALLNHVRPGDTIVVHSIDRLARNMADLLKIVETLNSKGVTLTFHKEALTFSGKASAMQTLQLQMMSAFAEFERSLITERAAEGREIARAKGVKFGRKPSLDEEQISAIRREHVAGKTIRDLAIDYDVGRSTISRALKRTA